MAWCYWEGADKSCVLELMVWLSDVVVVYHLYCFLDVAICKNYGQKYLSCEDLPY